jgi:hypothetical protein
MQLAAHSELSFREQIGNRKADLDDRGLPLEHGGACSVLLLRPLVLIYLLYLCG